jgi:hypothetical protein
LLGGQVLRLGEIVWQIVELSGVLVGVPDVRVVSESVDTVLRGPVRDQAELVGIINRLQGWGIELRGVQRLEPGDATSPQQNPTNTVVN